MIVHPSFLDQRMPALFITHQFTACIHYSLVQTEVDVSYNSDPPSEESEFHKCWISVVQGIHPLTQENAVKLAALQYQAYFLDRTAVNSVVGFSR